MHLPFGVAAYRVVRVVEGPVLVTGFAFLPGRPYAHLPGG